MSCPSIALTSRASTLACRAVSIGALTILLLGLVACATPFDATTVRSLPNEAAISLRLVTAGQPDRVHLLGLRARGYDAVIHIAADSASDVVVDEAHLLQAQSITYVFVPVRASALTSVNFGAVASALDALTERRVLVHCEQNILASSFVFLYRVINLREPPAPARADLERHWVPHGSVREFIDSQLRLAGFRFDAFE